ncbi:23S rRNA (uracil(1939)-C(5))-methyltransferase [Moraxella caviae]|uniref:23S rRNA (uracil(1939)-C(5))-methyltransferase RlmD n=1 Tax=Moraxella caviae TaxID=34060 RepID=A0A1S9ZVG8_9GAMM|nr:23S rRNA (uracil(1939)-C(5))-methyltransferase RlmD [Moraxella caviae]OOR87397.1 23S rRNA (uracil(1939)-C(5))-methyltransferase [Moraxella caviae]STZ10388.1 23S rRNA (uracil(1939)-C(5))-methyltransferase RlmD [Moraxella caviae]
MTNPALINAPSKKSGKTNARTRKRLQDAPPITFSVSGLAHDGRGVASYGAGTDDACQAHPADKLGKKVFVSFALPDEVVSVKLKNSKKTFEEGDALEVLANPHPERQTPPCPHFGVCGGCSLQHWHADGQIAFKQTVLAELLTHQAGVQPEHWLPPLTADRLGYRTKARMGVRYVEKKHSALVGFRERASNFLANLDECHILDPRVGQHISALKTLITTLEARDQIAQLELAAGETLDDVPDSAKSVAVIVRNLAPLPAGDIDKLQAFFAERHWQLFLQPHGSDSVQRIDDDNGRASSLTVPPTGGLFYRLPDFDVTFEFSPLDFTQVNLSVNRKMTKLACDLLDLQKGERVLDLFCGLGNFSLPLARMVGETGFVVGVEGSSEMTARAAMNAKANGIAHAEFYAQDLTQDFSHQPWATGENTFDALLIDPPRSGAAEVMAYLGKFNAKRIVYVSCNPATLARDTALLIAQGYKLTHAGVMDMFTHTGHVESIARFEKV